MTAKQQEGPTRQLSVRLDAVLYEDLTKVASEERRTLGNLINLSVKQFLQARYARPRLLKARKIKDSDTVR
jgi:hypothetical protein